uniref:Acetyltransferase n=1 Tax=Ascaris lumbricoides TaxID=6252 RepID=A0A0M3IFT8_ASCLU
MTTKGFDLLPKGVEETPFYHGLLPREDVVELLAEVDFIALFHTLLFAKIIITFNSIRNF